jgi:hypothetical protein
MRKPDAVLVSAEPEGPMARLIEALWLFVLVAAKRTAWLHFPKSRTSLRSRGDVSGCSRRPEELDALPWSA